jgi:hypothetical protein
MVLLDHKALQDWMALLVLKVLVVLQLHQLPQIKLVVMPWLR